MIDLIMDNLVEILISIPLWIIMVSFLWVVFEDKIRDTKEDKESTERERLYVESLVNNLSSCELTGELDFTYIKAQTNKLNK